MTNRRYRLFSNSLVTINLSLYKEYIRRLTMRTKEKKTKTIKKGFAGIIFMLISIFIFSCMVNAQTYDSYDGATHSDYEDSIDIYEDTSITGCIDNPNRYDCYRLCINTYPNGYYSFNFKFLQPYDDKKSKVYISIFKEDNRGDHILWNYNGVVQQSIKTNIGWGESRSLYILISSFSNLNYKFSVKYHESKHWEREQNDECSGATLIDFDKKIHGTSCHSSSGYDYDYYEVTIPSTGLLNFEMDRTPKKNHTIMIYNNQLKQIWKTKVTSESHISQKIKVTPGKNYIKIFGTNNDQYDFVVSHKQTTNEPNMPKIKVKKINKSSVKAFLTNPGGTFSGYQIQYSKDEQFKIGVSSKWVGGKKSKQTIIGGLEKNNFYYFRARTYNKVGNKIYYSIWTDCDFEYIE